jgi:KDO2-lipid IV(A) lauroyltransferase
MGAQSAPLVARVSWRRRWKNELLYLLAWVALGLLGRCPLRWLRPLGRRLGLWGFRLAGSERRRALRNLEAADLELEPRARIGLCREVFARLGHAVLEALALPRLGRNGRPLARFDAASLRLLGAEGGAVVTTAHLGNFELLAAAIAAERDQPVYVLARRSYDPRFTALLERRRRAAGVIPLWVEDRSCALRALRVLRAGSWVGVLIDRGPREGGELLPFFGRPAPTDLLAAGLSRVAQVPLHVGWVERREGEGAGASSEQRVTLEAISASGDDRARGDDRASDLARGDDLAVIGAATERLERQIRQHPADWLWTLDRWRDR